MNTFLKRIFSFGYAPTQTEPKTRQNQWQEIEYFDPKWENRIILMSNLIKTNGRLVDFGCGQQLLKKHLPKGCQYIPVDYTSRSEDTIVIDFNNGEQPKISGDVAFVSGFLEYVEKPKYFVNMLEINQYKEIVISYCTLENVPSKSERRYLGWKNDIGTVDFIKMFLGSFRLTGVSEIQSNTIFRFERTNSI